MDNKYIRLNTFIFFILIGIIFLLTPLIFFANSSEYYIYRFEDYGVYEEFKDISIDKDTVNEKFRSLLLNLTPFSDELDMDFYSNEDILHLYDVENILTGIYFVYIISLVSVYGIYKNKKIKINFNQVKGHSLIYISLSTIISFIIYLDFDFFFTLAHKVAFQNDYWLLNPESSNLIKFFPQELFFEVFVLVIIINLLMHISFIMLSNKINEKRNSK